MRLDCIVHISVLLRWNRGLREYDGSPNEPWNAWKELREAPYQNGLQKIIHTVGLNSGHACP
jgi:hypothetical protein